MVEVASPPHSVEPDIVYSSSPLIVAIVASWALIVVEQTSASVALEVRNSRKLGLTTLMIFVISNLCSLKEAWRCVVLLMLFKLLFRHLMCFDNFPVAGGVELQRENESGFQLARRSPITRRIKDRSISIGPVAHLQNVTVRRATARVKVFWQMALAKLR